MADGDVFQLVNDVLGSMGRFLEYLFYVGALYGAKKTSKLVIHTWKGFRTYFIPFGRVSSTDLSEKYGKWALITGGTTGIGLAYAYEVRSCVCVCIFIPPFLLVCWEENECDFDQQFLR